MIVKKRTVTRAGSLLSALTFPHSLMLQLRQSQSLRHKIQPCQLHETGTLSSLKEAELSLDVSLMIWLFFGTEEEMLGEIFLNLPIWANFIDPTDLSQYYYVPTLDQTSYQCTNLTMFARNEFLLWPKQNLNDKSLAERKWENTSKKFRLSWDLSFKQAICFILLILDKDV